MDLLRIVAAAIAWCASVAESALLPPPEYVYAEGSVTCTVSQCMLDDPAVMHSMCCVRAIHAAFPYPPPKRKPRDPHAPPESLTSTDVKAGIAAIRGRIDACRERHPGTGTVKLTASITPGGTVDTATVDPPSGDDAFDACITAAFRRARFPTSETGARFRYPFLRRAH